LMLKMEMEKWNLVAKVCLYSREMSPFNGTA
jgi:hypothetical protein